MACLQVALTESGLPKDAVQLVEDQSHAVATEMMHLTGYIDVLIPRGGKGLIARVLETATVPVIETGAGNCHIYIDQSADLAVAAPIVVNAKVQRPSVCNAAEKLLVNQAVAEEQLPSLVAALREHGVEVRGDERARAIVSDLVPATDADWDTEYNDLIMAVKVVDDLDEAIQWINQHSTHHPRQSSPRTWSGAGPSNSGLIRPASTLTPRRASPTVVSLVLAPRLGSQPKSFTHGAQWGWPS